MTPDVLIALLREFWKASVPQVSPGTLGMFYRGRPFEEAELVALVNRTPGVQFLNGWMVKQ